MKILILFLLLDIFGLISSPASNANAKFSQNDDTFQEKNQYQEGIIKMQHHHLMEQSYHQLELIYLPGLLLTITLQETNFIFQIPFRQGMSINISLIQQLSNFYKLMKLTGSDFGCWMETPEQLRCKFIQLEQTNQRNL